MAYRYNNIFFNDDIPCRLFSNIFLFILGFLPSSQVQQYIFIILNASMGVYILFYSVIANTQVKKLNITEIFKT